MAGAAGTVDVDHELEKQTKEKIIDQLADFAAADADHDFSSKRAGGNLFSQIFAKYKTIGTPNAPSERLKDEDAIMNTFLHYYNRGKRYFKDEFLIDDAKFTFNRWADDKEGGEAMQYTVHTKKVAEKAVGERRWLLSPEDLYDFLNPDKVVYAFTIDATSVPFYDLLLEKGEQKGEVHYVFPREGINDAAGKVIIDQRPGTAYTIKVNEVQDTHQETIVYPSPVNSKGEFNNPQKKDAKERDLFYSNFSVFVSPVKQDGKAKSVNIEISNKDFKRQVSVLKGVKEDAHPNAVATLSRLIMGILSGILAQGGHTNKERQTYHTYLQQKRSGDWLQVQACLDPGRFNLPPGCRIQLVTMDRICLAYALAMGADCLFTSAQPKAGGGYDYWLVSFRRGKQGAAWETLKKQIAQAKATMDPDAPIVVGRFSDEEDHGKFTRAAEFYNEYIRVQREELIQELGGSIFKETSVILGDGRNRRTKITEHIRDVLNRALKLSVFSLHAVPINEPDKLAELFTKDITNKTSDNNLKVYMTRLSKYKEKYAFLKRVLSTIPQKGTYEVNIAILNYYRNIISSLTSTAGEVKELIEKLQIFSSMFGTANGPKSGVGIFSFLSNALPEQQRADLLAGLVRLQDLLRGEVGYLDSYQKFLATAQVLGGQRPTSADAIKKISSKALLTTINALHPKDISEAEVTNKVNEITAEQEATKAATKGKLRQRGGATEAEITDAKEALLAAKEQKEEGEAFIVEKKAAIEKLLGTFPEVPAPTNTAALGQIDEALALIERIREHDANMLKEAGETLERLTIEFQQEEAQKKAEEEGATGAVAAAGVVAEAREAAAAAHIAASAAAEAAEEANGAVAAAEAAEAPEAAGGVDAEGFGDTQRITDFAPAVAVIQEKVRQTFGIEVAPAAAREFAEMLPEPPSAPAAEGEAPEAEEAKEAEGEAPEAEEATPPGGRGAGAALAFEGGAQPPKPERAHSPIITFYFFLREISFRMSYEEEELPTLDAMCQIVIRLIKAIQTEPLATQPALFNVAEIFLLEQFSEYDALPRKVASSTSYVEQVMLSVKDGYYGFRHIPDHFIQPLSATPRLTEVVQRAMNLKEHSLDTDKVIDMTLKVMSNLIDYIDVLEKGPSRDTRRSSKKPKVKLVQKFANTLRQAVQQQKATRGKNTRSSQKNTTKKVRRNRQGQQQQFQEVAVN